MLVFPKKTEYNGNIFYCLCAMYRSLILDRCFPLFSVALPCVCSNEFLVLAADDSCGSLSLGVHAQNTGHGTMSMSLFDHIASWRDFFSSSLPVAFFILFGTTLLNFGRREELFFKWNRLFEFHRILFRSPERFDARAALSRPFLRAFYSGVLHAKISH